MLLTPQTLLSALEGSLSESEIEGLRRALDSLTPGTSIRVEGNGNIVGDNNRVVYNIFPSTEIVERFREFQDPPTDSAAIDPDLIRFLRHLKGNNKAKKPRDRVGRYLNRCNQKLDGHLEISLRVKQTWDSDDSAIVSAQFGRNAAEGNALDVITRVFKVNGRLLIVGEPGSGKTVLLLKLAIRLLDELPANNPDSGLVPVVFNLSSWSEQYALFGDWLNAVLVSGYGLSKGFASELLSKQKIILLLDGLDELARTDAPNEAARKRAACLTSLNHYLQDERRMIICCRTEQFLQIRESTGQDAPAPAKIEVLSLTDEQIRSALSVAATDEKIKHHAAARNFLKRDRGNRALAEVLRTPFFFNIAQTVFDHESFEKEVPNDAEKLKTWLLKEFVEAKFSEPDKTHFCSSVKAKAWITWLAQHMRKHDQTTFELADLEARHLKARKLYVALFCTFLSVYFHVLLLNGWEGLLFAGFGLILMVRKLRIPTMKLSDALSWALCRDVAIYSLIGFFINSLPFYFLTPPLLFLASDRFAAVMSLVLSYVLFLPTIVSRSLCIGIWGFLIQEWEFQTEDVVQWDISSLFHWATWRQIVGSALRYGFLFSLIVGLPAVMFAVIQRLISSILFQMAYFHTQVTYAKAAELNFSLQGLWVALLAGTLLSLMLSLKNALAHVMKFAYLAKPYQRLKGGLVINIVQWTVLLVVLFTALILRVFFENGSEEAVSSNQMQPGEVTILLVLGIIALIILLMFVFVYASIGGIAGTAFFNHAMLRLCLYLEGAIPLRYVRFLDYATASRILEKDGGQWRFRHQYLQDYFSGDVR